MLLRILFILIPTLLLPSIYLTWRFRRTLNTVWQKVLVFLPAVTLLIIGFILATNRSYSPKEYEAVGLLTITILVYASMLLILALCCLAGRVFKRWANVEKAFWGIGIACCIVLLGVSLYSYHYGIYKLQTTHEDLYFDDLPEAFDNYRIVFFTDYHLGTYGDKTKFPRRVIDAIIREKGDIVLCGGDLINYDTKEILPFIHELKRIKAPDGVYTVMGNHDYQIHRKWSSQLAQTNSVQKFKGLHKAIKWRLLLNESCFIRRGSDSIAIIGVENDGRPPFPELGDLPKALRNVPDSLKRKPFFKILITHDPTHWRRKVLPETDIQLTLAGHTHAGQFQLGKSSPVAKVYKEWGGLYESGDRKLFVSKGIGQALLNFRLGAWPEINVITLHCRK